MITIWRHGPGTIWEYNPEADKDSSKDTSRSDHDCGTHIVKAGTVYTQSDDFQKASLDVFLNQKRTSGQLQEAYLGTKVNNAKSDDLVYQPLTGKHDMRVLELHAGRPEDKLSCILHVCSVNFQYPASEDHLEQRTSYYRPHTLHAVSCSTGLPVWYTALSYVWGDPALVKTMSCNNKPFAITKNLELALHCLRRSDVSIMLWVDQICINQDDLQEKSQQVVLMGVIYQRAWSTAVWLGEEADNSSGAFDTLLATKEALQYYPNEKSLEVGDFERLYLPASDSSKWPELGKLMNRPWFQRIWIVQEVVLSHQITVMCGARCISWADLYLFALCVIDTELEQYLYRPGTPRAKNDNSESGCIRTRKINEIKDYNFSSPRKVTFLAGLVDGRSAKSTDPRDKVFAIMGLTNTLMYPNYSSKVIDVYTQAALKIATTPELGSLLCCVDHPQPTPGQPSWVPDWATPRQTVSLGYGAKHHKVYQASTQLEMQSRTDITENGAALAITGVIVDTVARVGMVSEEPDLKDLLITETPTSRFVLEGINLAIGMCQPYPSSKWSIFEAFSQTLVAGKDHSNLAKAPDEFLPIFALLFDTATQSSPSFPDQPPLSTKRKLTLENLQVRSPARTYRHMQTAVKAAVRRRRLGVTTQRYLGLFPRGTKAGDHVCVFTGACVPFVIRRCESRDEYQLVGECYVHGIMDGEVEVMSDMQKREIYIT